MTLKNLVNNIIKENQKSVDDSFICEDLDPSNIFTLEVGHDDDFIINELSDSQLKDISDLLL